MAWGGRSQRFSLRKLLIRHMQISKGPGLRADKKGEGGGIKENAMEVGR